MSILNRLPFPNRNSESGVLYIVFKQFHLIFPVEHLEFQIDTRFMHFLSYLAFCAFLIYVCLSCHDLHRSECIELVNMPSWVMFQHVPVFTKSENWLCFCYVHMLAIEFSDPFWLKVTKGLLLISLSRSVPCFTLPCSGPVACGFVAPKSATWSEIPDKC